MKIRRTFAYSLLAFLLLVSQQLGIAHAISHLSVTASSGSLQKKGLPADASCEKCLAFAAIGSALTGSPPPLAHSHATEEAPVAIFAREQLPRFWRSFNPRAPPLLS